MRFLAAAMLSLLASCSLLFESSSSPESTEAGVDGGTEACAPPWIFGISSGGCYLVIESTTWSNQTCGENYLAVPGSNEELQDIYRDVAGARPAWLGGIVNEGILSWVEGEDTEYTPDWLIAPTTADSGCVYLDASQPKIAFYDCNSSVISVCERR